MKQTTTFNAITATLVFFVLGAPATVLANTSGSHENNTATVMYADLNLGNEAGVKVLYSRLKHASKDVCGVASILMSGTLSRIQQSQQCYRETLTQAVEKIDNDLLTRIHAS